MIWTRLPVGLARMKESRNVYRVLVGRSQGKRWEDNIKMDLRGKDCNIVD